MLALLSLLAVAAASPQYKDQYATQSASQYGGSSGQGGGKAPIPILRDEREGPDALGNYNFLFETGNGISRQELGSPEGPEGAVAQQGGWTFTFPDGTPAKFNFVADENGYRVESDLLPVGPPMPAHALAQIEKALQEDKAAASGAGGYKSQSGGQPQYGGSQTQY